MVQQIKKTLVTGEFSKVFAVWIMIVFALIVFTMLGLVAFVNINLGGTFTAILGILVTIPVSVIGFYYQKAKTENVAKINNSSSGDSTTNSN